MTRTCVVEDCDRKYWAKGWCRTHYERMKRFGRLGLRDIPTTLTTTTGYVKVKVASGHPLIDRSGRAYQHRLVLFDALGDGPHPCHWCGAGVDWGAGLEADHVDFDRSNNANGNLVAACHGCNSRRAMARYWKAKRGTGV